MSLLKAYQVQNKAMIETNYEELREYFKEHIDLATMNSISKDAKLKSIHTLITIYSIYGVKYLMEVSDNLYEKPYNKDTMSYMNSFIVELLYSVELKYYMKDMSYSVVDKTVQHTLDIVLDNPSYTLSEIIENVDKVVVQTLDDIMASFKEED